MSPIISDICHYLVALGHAVLESLTYLGTLDAQAMNKKFEENLLGPAQTLAKDLAKMALKIN